MVAWLIGIAVWLLTYATFVVWSLLTGVWLPIGVIFGFVLSLVATVSFAIAINVRWPVAAVVVTHAICVVVTVVYVTAAVSPGPLFAGSSVHGVVNLTPAAEPPPIELILLEYIGLGSLPNVLITLLLVLLERRLDRRSKDQTAIGKLVS